MYLNLVRFESLTLSHNNMIALKPVLLAWLEEAEAARRDPVSFLSYERFQYWLIRFSWEMGYLSVGGGPLTSVGW